jgi:hypothetical protein
MRSAPYRSAANALAMSAATAMEQLREPCRAQVLSPLLQSEPAREDPADEADEELGLLIV